VKAAEPTISSATVDEILGITAIGDDDLDTVRQRMLPGLCHWILEKEPFRDWRDNNESNVFWLTGLPGTGKTTLAGFIIDHLHKIFVPGTCQYHFFQAEHHDTRTISYFLRSIAFQISKRHHLFRTMLLRMHQETGISFATQKHNLI
jgi:Cdc6-like AAA superfamily ATPase